MTHYANQDIQRAYIFARAAHESVNQKRKYTNENYIVHPIEVANTMLELQYDNATVMAALLHDVVEDCNITLGQIYDNFGQDVEYLVSKVTDISTKNDGNRAARKAIDARHAATGDYRSQSIKVADFLSNEVDIKQYDQNFYTIWMREKYNQLSLLKYADSRLLIRSDVIFDKFFSKK